MSCKITLIALFVVGVGVPAAYAASSYDPDFDEKPWVEQQTQLPAFPKPENLMRIRLDSMTNFDVAIDAASVDLGTDGVIRYTLVARSGQGAENIYFEGIRCRTHERKRYAVGKSDRTWSQVTSASWAPYSNLSRNYQADLADNFFCPLFGPVTDVPEILKIIRAGGLTLDQRQRGD